MGAVETADEAIATIDATIVRWSEALRGVWTQASARLSAALAEIERETRARANRVVTLRAAVAAASDEARPALEVQLDAARQAYEGARRASGAAARAREQLQAAVRHAGPAVESTAPAARADLRRRLDQLGAYRAARGTAGGPPGGALPGGATAEHALSSRGLQDVGVVDADFSDNPLGGFGKGLAAKADYRWAVETWETVVRPGIASGMTRDDFAARDAARNAPALRRTADVFDLFLGDADRIVVSRSASGRLEVVNGRHRIEVARELGIDHLPARVIG